jgi:hypothetical protein
MRTERVLLKFFMVALWATFHSRLPLFAEINPPSKNTEQLRTCGTLIGSLSYLLVPPNLRPHKLQSYIGDNSTVGKFTADQVAIISEIFSYTGNRRPGLENFIYGIRSSQHITPRLEWERTIIEKAKSGELTMTDYLKFPELKGVQKIWEEMKSRGWSVEIIRGRFHGRIHPVKFNFERKKISISLALGFHPKPLLLAAHLHYAELFFSIYETPSRIQSLRAQIEKKFANHSFREADKESFIQECVRYVIAREAILRTIPDYEALVGNHIFFQVKGWAYMKHVNRDNIDGILAKVYRQKTKEQRERDFQMAVAGERHWSVEDYVRSQLREENSFLDDLLFRYLLFKPEELESLRQISVP